MTPMGQHERKHRDRLLPVLFLIVCCGLLEVWASWLMIGSVSGFPKLGRMTTGWILPVSTEAYWSIAVVAWLADPAGPRSRKFAMWTAGIMFAFSLAGQELGHLLAAAHKPPSTLLVMFVTALPLIAVALGAVLVHLRQADREEAEALAETAAEAARMAAIERAEADERAALRARVGELATALAARDEEHGSALAEVTSALEDARREAAAATAKAEALTRKLAAATGSRKGGSATRKPAAKSTRKPEAETPQVPAANPDDLPGNWDALDTEARVLFLVSERGYSGSRAGVVAGVTDARGRQIARAARELSQTAPQEALTESGTAEN